MALSFWMELRTMDLLLKYRLLFLFLPSENISVATFRKGWEWGRFLVALNHLIDKHVICRGGLFPKCILHLWIPNHSALAETSFCPGRANVSHDTCFLGICTFWVHCSSSTQADSMSGFLLCVLSFCEHFKEGTMAACELITYYFTFIGSYIFGVLWQNPAGVWDGNDQDPGSACLAKAWSRTRQPGWDDGSWLILKQLKLPRKLCLCWFFVIFLNFTLRHHLKNVGRFSVSLGTWWRLWESHLHSGRILALPSSPLPGQVPGCSISCFLNTTPFRSTAKNPPPPQRTKRQLRLNSTDKETDLSRRASFKWLASDYVAEPADRLLNHSVLQSSLHPHSGTP